MKPTKPPILQTLIVDDEPDARELLHNWLEKMEAVEIIGSVGDAVKAAEVIRQKSPQLVLLDIQMPELDAFGLIESVGLESMPLIIFSTAYDEHALKAFEINAVDYLLKPYSRNRLKQAIDRARERLQMPKEEQTSTLKRFLYEFQHGSSKSDSDNSTTHYRKRIVIKSTNPWKQVECNDIYFIQSDGAYTRIGVEEKTYTHFESISALEERLDPRLFMRVHRTAIINLKKVSRIVTLPYGTRQVVMTNGAKVKVSRSYREELHARLVLVSAEDA